MIQSGTYAAYFPLGPFWIGTAVDVVSARAGNLRQVMESLEFYQGGDAFSLAVFRDGCIALQLREEHLSTSADDMQSVAQRWSSYLTHLNAFDMLLGSACVELQAKVGYQVREITRDEVVTTQLDERGVYMGGSLQEFGPHQLFMSARHEYIRLPAEQLPFERRYRRTAMPLHVVTHAVARFTTVVEQDQTESLATLSRSISEYRTGNLQSCVVLAWFVVERELTRRWKMMVNGSRAALPNDLQRINSEREKVLLGREFTAHIRSEFLELQGHLSHDEYRAVDKARARRNDAIHNKGKALTQQDAEQVLDTAALLMAVPCHGPVELIKGFGFIGI